MVGPCGLRFLKGGDLGPYYQSQRLELYNKEVIGLSEGKLLLLLHPEELAQRREEAIKPAS